MSEEKVAEVGKRSGLPGVISSGDKELFLVTSVRTLGNVFSFSTSPVLSVGGPEHSERPGLNTISAMVIMKTAANAIAPARAGYCSLKNGGRHGSIKDINAVGIRCTNAVAMRTPVPKCLKPKCALAGIRSCGTLSAIIGSAHAPAETPRIMKRAPTCKDRL